MQTQELSPIVLILGSAPDVVLCRSWSKPEGFKILAINNAWKVRDDWDFLITPDDFPSDRMPATLSEQQKSISSAEYVPANNRFGGVFYAGGTMAFTAGYWALDALNPSIMAFLGCDMNYSNPVRTHFYGTGKPDPLRADPSLRNLEAKSARLMLHAQRLGCLCVRLSLGASRLVFPSARYEELVELPPHEERAPNPLFELAKAKEDGLGYHVPSGKYWETSATFDTTEIDAVDQMWLEAADACGASGSAFYV